MKRWHTAGLTFLALSLILLGSCTLPTHYGEIIIDTYLPDASMVFSPHTVITLFGPYGEQAAAIATNTGGKPRPYVWARSICADRLCRRLDSGRYYIQVKGNSSTDYGAYAIRILTSLPTPAYSSVDYFSDVNNPDSYEPDDAVANSIPTHPVAITIGDRINRYLAVGGDVDWFALTLP